MHEMMPPHRRAFPASSIHSATRARVNTSTQLPLRGVDGASAAGTGVPGRALGVSGRRGRGRKKSAFTVCAWCRSPDAIMRAMWRLRMLLRQSSHHLKSGFAAAFQTHYRYLVGRIFVLNTPPTHTGLPQPSPKDCDQGTRQWRAYAITMA